MNIRNIIAAQEVEFEAAQMRQRKARAELEHILDDARKAGRANLTVGESSRTDELFAEIEKCKAQEIGIKDKLARSYKVQSEEAEMDARMNETPVAATEARANGTVSTLQVGRTGQTDRASNGFVYRESGNLNGHNAAVARGESIKSHEVAKEHAASRSAADGRIMDANGGDFGQMLRAMTTSSVSAIVPTDWSNNIIDLARNHTVVFEAGATLVPMADKVVKIGRLTTDASPAFKAESSPVTAADLAFDNVTLTATSLSAIAVASREFVQDGINAGNLIMDSLAKAMALQLDLVALFGQLAAGNEPQAGNLASPNPQGLLAALLAYNSGSNVLGGVTNGTTLTSTAPYAEIINAVYKVKRANEVPGAIVSNDALVQIYDNLYSSTNQPLKRPDVVSAQPWLTTNAIPSFTAGTMTNVATDLFVGDWSQMLVGQRLDMEIRVLNERYAENGQVAYQAYWRGDVQLARPGAFCAYRYLKGAA